MKTSRRGLTALAALGLILATATGAKASNDGWSGEITPYFWAPGIKGDVTIRNRTAAPDTNMKDIFDHVHGGFSFLGSVDYQRWVGYAQGDWARLSNDQDVATAAGKGTIHAKSDFHDYTFAGGRRFDGFNEKSSIDVMAGIRFTHLDTELTGFGLDASDDRNLVDGVAVFRPRYQFADWVALSPTFSLGGGQSDFTYELSPQFQFDYKSLSARIGYRRLHYKFHNDNGSFDGALHGFLLGVGYKF